MLKLDEINTEKKNIYQIFKNVVSLINTKAIMTNIQVELFTDSEEIIIECSENQLKQVFINILQNSIEAMLKWWENFNSYKKNIKNGFHY